MTLHEDTEDSTYTPLDVASTKLPPFDAMADPFDPQSIKIPVKCEIHPPTTDSTRDVSTVMNVLSNDGNNNSGLASTEYRSYMKFDESINKLPNESSYIVNQQLLNCDLIVNPAFQLNSTASYMKPTMTSIVPSTASTLNCSSPDSLTFADVNLNDDTINNKLPSNATGSNDDLSTRIVKKLRAISCAGIVLALLSGVFFATAGFIVKLVPDINPIQIVICRSMIQSLVYLPIILYFRTNLLGERGERLALQARGLFGFIAFTLCYVSYRMIPLADASTIVFSAPVYVSVFACVLLKEECAIFQAFTVIVTIIGVLLISKPTFIFGDAGDTQSDVALRVEGTVIAFISSLSAALSFVLMRKLQRTSSPVVINMFSFVSIICGVISLVIIRTFFYEEAGMLAQGVGVPVKAWDIYWLIANGACGVLGQLCLTVALKIEEAGLVSLARTVDIVMAFIFQVAFLKEELVHWTSILGAVIVCFGVCISALRRWLRSKPGEYKHLWLILNCGIPRETEGQFNLEKSVATVKSPVNGSRYKANIQSFVDLSKAGHEMTVASRTDDKV